MAIIVSVPPHNPLRIQNFRPAPRRSMRVVRAADECVFGAASSGSPPQVLQVARLRSLGEPRAPSTNIVDVKR